ncbi:MAG: hypothetical protein VX335_01420 [Pseudomonadota bacterium]|nr:hypothetical protein [Pseudomonadota bacterium]
MKKTLIIILALLTSSCSNYQAESFSSNSIDVFTAQKNLAEPIAIATLSATNNNQNSIFCRGLKRSIYLPNKMSFTKYIEDALKETLINANRYDSKSEYVLRGKIDLVDFNSTSGRWHLKGIFNLNNSIPVKIEGKYDFPSAWDNDIACGNAASALNQAVSKFVADIFSNPAIKKALR